MNLLPDENLSRKLVVRLGELYPGQLTSDFDLLACPDREVWALAQREDYIIVSTDADFYELATTLGPPPKVVWLRRWAHPPGMPSLCSDATPFAYLAEFAADADLAILVLDRLVS